MNSEELEQSLRTEFESYLKDVLSEMKQEVADFQKKFDEELGNHKSKLDGFLQEFSSKFEDDRQLEISFKDSIVEHLRLSRDEGARITATAIAAAEDLQKQTESENAAVAAPIDYTDLRDAIQDISEKDSQSAILKALVTHAAQYTPRGAFFIIKNEHFVGWRVFGSDGETDDSTVREVFFPVSSDTVLGESVRSLSATESNFGTYAEDSLFLNKLEFGQPEKMFAVPLVARRRGVAVLYADQGTGNEKVNLEAIETLVRVAGMTVELLAASQGAKPHSEEQTHSNAAAETAPQDYQPKTADSASQNYQPESERLEAKNSDESFETAHQGSGEFEYSPPVETSANADEEAVETAAQPFTNYSYEEPKHVEPEKFAAFDDVKSSAEETDEETETEPGTAASTSGYEYSWNQPADNFGKYEEETKKPETVEEKPSNDFAFETSGTAIDETAIGSNPVSANEFEYTHQPSDEFSPENFSTTVETADIQSPQFETTGYRGWDSGTVEEPKFETPDFETAGDYQAGKFENNFETAIAAPVETVSEAVAAPPKSRLSERNVDLPIEVAEDERRSHNDARRFARLLVSEIKLYNEQKVKEGREMSDLYDRLREAIDRSREMYNKRVQPPVAAKFDYFHYELVNNLAEGEESKLGAGYPGED